MYPETDLLILSRRSGKRVMDLRKLEKSIEPVRTHIKACFHQTLSFGNGREYVGQVKAV